MRKPVAALVLAVCCRTLDVVPRRRIPPLCLAGCVALAPAPATPISTDDAEKIAASVTTLRDLTRNFETIAKVKLGSSLDDSFDGDEVRRRLGFVGTTSPLYRIESTLRRALDVDHDDDIDLAELRVDFGRSLQLANDMAYSAIFSDPSGNAGMPGQRGIDYLMRSKDAAADSLRLLEKLAAALGVGA